MNKQLFPVALLATGLGATAFAQAVSEQTEPELAVLPEFKTVDANEDGMIEAAETEGLAEKLREEHQISFQFESVDRNRDGMINTQEYIAYDGVLKERLGIA